MGKILVVDDDRAIGDLFKRILSRYGHEVFVAYNGEQGLQLLKSAMLGSITMVFLDLKMPGLSGEQTLTRLRENYQDLPVAIISGYAVEDTLTQLYAKNIISFIPKPFSIETIADLVQQVVDSAPA